MILATIAAIKDAGVRKQLDTVLDSFPEGWENLVHAIRQILAGEQDSETLCEFLGFDDAPIIIAILEGIANPESLAWLEESEPSQE